MESVSVNDLLKLFMRQAQRERRVPQPRAARSLDVKARQSEQGLLRDMPDDDAHTAEGGDHD